MTSRFCEPLEPRVLLVVPNWSNFDFDPQTDHGITINFDVNVRPGEGISNGLEPTDLVVQKVGAADFFILQTEIDFSNPFPGMQATFEFINQAIFAGRTDILPEGNYKASIAQQDVADGAQNEFWMQPGSAVRDFHVLRADGNQDRDVNLQDFNIIAGHFGQSPATHGEGDYNYDGIVSLPDFNPLAGKFGTSLPEPPTDPDDIMVGENANFTFTLSWVDPIVPPNEEQGWRVQRSLNGQFSDAVIQDLGANTVSWPTPAFPDGTRVWWRVRAYGNGQDTGYTAKRYGVTPLPAPQITHALALSASQIQITFTDNSQNETSFQVYRSLSMGGEFLPVGSPIPTGPPSHQFIDNGLTPNTTYYYHVRARNAVTDSAPSNIDNALTQPTEFPAPPTGLTATYQTAPLRIALDWNDNTEPGGSIQPVP